MKDEAFREGSFVPFDRCTINLDQVRRFEYVDDRRVRVWWANGDEEVLSASDKRRITAQRYRIIPAALGFELLTYWPDPEDEIEEVERAPIVAWRINDDQTEFRYVDETIIAISTGGTSADDAGNMRVAVRHPDGKVTHYRDGQRWANVEEWQTWAREDWRQAEEDRKEKQRRAALKVVGAGAVECHEPRD